MRLWVFALSPFISPFLSYQDPVSPPLPFLLISLCIFFSLSTLSSFNSLDRFEETFLISLLFFLERSCEEGWINSERMERNEGFFAFAFFFFLLAMEMEM